MNQMSENEIADQDFTSGFLQLYSIANVENASESLTVLLHVFLLEVGFIPKNVSGSDLYEHMPENWKTVGCCKILYYHKDITEVLCWVTFVSIGGKLSIQGSLQSNQLRVSNVHFYLQVNTFVNLETRLSNPHTIFTNIKELAINFKDGFCFPLLSLIYESVKRRPKFGLCGLVEEAKVYILKLLPPESVVSLSAVNKDFHAQANSAYLWKFLFNRDFGPRDSGVTHINDEDWKEIYKAEYFKKKRRYEFRSLRLPVYHPYLFSEMYPFGSQYGVDPRLNMDPSLQLAFPNMRARFRPNWPFPGAYQSYQYYGRF